MEIYNNNNQITLTPFNNSWEFELDNNEKNNVYFNLNKHLAKQSIIVKNIAKRLILINPSTKNVVINENDHIATMRTCQSACPDLIMKKLPEHDGGGEEKEERGTGGFGSTGA